MSKSDKVLTLRIEPKVLRAILAGEGRTFNVGGQLIHVERFGQSRKGPTWACIWCHVTFDGPGAKARTMLHQHEECSGRPFSPERVASGECKGGAS